MTGRFILPVAPRLKFKLRQNNSTKLSPNNYHRVLINYLITSPGAEAELAEG
jgi:hypothetical protein